MDWLKLPSSLSFLRIHATLTSKSTPKTLAYLKYSGAALPSIGAFRFAPPSQFLNSSFLFQLSLLVNLHRLFFHTTHDQSTITSSRGVSFLPLSGAHKHPLPLAKPSNPLSATIPTSRLDLEIILPERTTPPPSFPPPKRASRTLGSQPALTPFLTNNSGSGRASSYWTTKKVESGTQRSTDIRVPFCFSIFPQNL